MLWELGQGSQIWILKIFLKLELSQDDLSSLDYFMDIIYAWWIGSHVRLSLQHFMGPHSAVKSGMDGGR